jgi:hypothetical protein
MDRFNTRQCRCCNANCQVVFTQRSSVLVDDETVLLFPFKGGKDTGYTPSGRGIVGVITKPEDRIKGYGYYEVHRVHRCGRDKEDGIHQEAAN